MATFVSGPLVAVSDTATQATAIQITAGKARPHGAGMVTGETRQVSISSTGQVNFTAVPGPILITLVADGEVLEHYPGMVPDTTTATLAEVVSAEHAWTPEQMTMFQQLTAQAKAAAAAAEADRLLTEADRIQTGLDRAAAEGSATLAGTWANVAEGHAAATAADRAQTDQDRAAAEAAAQGADASELAAAQHLAAIEPLAQGVDAAVPIVTAAASTATQAAGEAGTARDEAVDAADRATLIADPDGTLASKADLVGGVIPTSQIPEVALTKPAVVHDRASMLGLTAQEGDVAVINAGPDQGTYMLGEGPGDVFESWVPLAASPDAPVRSVNGQTGTVVLGPTDVGAATASHTHPTLEAAIATRQPRTHTATAVTDFADLPAQVGDLIIMDDAAGYHYLLRVSSLPLSTTGGYEVLHYWQERVRTVAGKTGTVTLTASDVGASPTGHKHTKVDITDLPTITASATGSAVVQRDSSGRINLPTTAPTTAQAVRRDWVEAAITAGPSVSTLAHFSGLVLEKSGRTVIAHITNLGSITGITALPLGWRPTREITSVIAGAITTVSTAGAITKSASTAVTGQMMWHTL